MSSPNYPKNGFRPNPPLTKKIEASQSQELLTTDSPTEIARKRLSAILEGAMPVDETQTLSSITANGNYLNNSVIDNGNTADNNTINGSTANGNAANGNTINIRDRTALEWPMAPAINGAGANGMREAPPSPKEQNQHPAFQTVYRESSKRQNTLYNHQAIAPEMTDVAPVTPVAPVMPVTPAPVIASISEPVETQTDPLDTITIRGRADGISIEIGEGRWPDMMVLLSERLTQSGAFFRGGQVALNVGTRQLSEEDVRQVQVALERYNMSLGVIRSASETTAYVALSMGIAVSIEGSDPTRDVHARHAASNDELLSYFVYRGNLRSGQILKMEETILVIGDVNPGAEVISAGDIFVWGRLRGIAHAGATGDINSVVAALDLEPVQLRIAGEFSISPQNSKPTVMDRFFRKQALVKQPELARIAHEQIIVEVWNETSVPGGFSVFRR